MKRYWQRCAKQDQKPNDVDTTEKQDGLVLAQVLVGNDGTQNRRDVAPEPRRVLAVYEGVVEDNLLEESSQASCSLVSHSQCATASRAIKRSLDVVLSCE